MSAFFSDEIIAALSAPLAREHVKDREQAGRKVSYIEGWHVIAEANRIFGFDGWSRETVMSECCYAGEYQRPVWENGRKTDKTVTSFRCSYRAKVRIQVGRIIREGSGHGNGFADNPGDAHESAEKEAETDAMKRALMTFGNQFGLALYDKAQSNVEAPSRPAVASARPSQAEPPKTNGKHPKWDYAGARFREIERAIKGAADPKIVSEIWGVNQADLDLIEEVGLPYDKLEALRDHMLTKLSQSRVNAGRDFVNEARMGSAPMLTGEP
jgi:DNA recombination protein Rad52